MGAALRALLITPAVARAFYEAQCEVGQAFTAWLRVLDRRGRIECVPISDDFVATARGGWETLLNDEIARLVSPGDFSRTALVRSFVRTPGGGPLPTVFQLRGYNTSL